MIEIAASLASAPLSHLQRTIKELEDAGIDILHFDVEDGNFVPMMTLGLKIIKDLRPLTRLPFDIHLMINNPEWIITDLKKIGVDMLSVHFEACEYPRRTLGLIHRMGIRAGLAFNPKTSLPNLRQYLPYLSFVLILTTEPEQPDAKYMPIILDKLAQGKKAPELENVKWQVDGGFSDKNICDAKSAGADIVVSGRGVFLNGEIRKNVLKMRKIISQC